MNTPPYTRSETQLAARYEALLRVLHMLTAPRDPKALFRALASELRHVVTFDGISIVLYDEAGHKLHVPVLEVVNQPDIVPPQTFR